MHNNKIAKNLLEDKTCDNCNELKRCSFNGKEYCGPGPLSEDLRRCFAKECEHPPLPKERTCENWKLMEGSGILTRMFDVLRKQYPSMVASDIVGVWPKPKK